MVRFHHVNLGIPVGAVEEQAAFLVGILGYQRLATPAESPSANWFESDDGHQIHLSQDPDHRPPARAHVAVELTAGEFDDVRANLDRANYPFDQVDLAQRRQLGVRDPAGNLWEIRAQPPA